MKYDKNTEQQSWRIFIKDNQKEQCQTRGNVFTKQQNGIRKGKWGFNDKTKELNHNKSKVKNNNSNITMTWRTTLNPWEV